MGVDAIGLVFFHSSPRAVGVKDARSVVANLPPFATVVGLFVDAPRDEVHGILSQVRIDLLQFHGDEEPDYCAGFGRPYIKAIRMRPGVDLGSECDRFRGAAALLLDAYQPDVKGGTGHAFDWRRAVGTARCRLILAGGLSPENVGSALAIAHPYAVDVSSGVESAKGIKDPDKMAKFLNEVYEFDHRQRFR